MVNRGRSQGCMTCKQRRVKCDEAKPNCRSCLRLGFRCRGYNKPKSTQFKFKDQNHRFYAKPNHNVHFRGNCHVVGPASSLRGSAESDAQDREAVNALSLRRLSEPETAVPFFLGHYASMGRDMGSTRGFFEMLVPAYASQRQESALSLAVSALASEILSDPIERSRPATVLAVLALQTYENASAIYHLHRASSTHHNGAASLLLCIDPNGMDSTVRAYLQRFMLHTEVSTAIRQKRPLNSIAYSWMGSKDTSAVPDNPSSALDTIGALFAELQASYTQSMTQRGSTTSLDRGLKEWRAEAMRLDAKLQAWAETVPDRWRPLRLVSGRDFDSSIPTYQSVCEVYPSCQIASVWNLWHIQRLLLAKMMLGSLNAFPDPTRFGFTYGHFLGDPTELFACQQTLQEVVDRVCYSIPFHLGNRTTRVSLTDFTDPTVLLPSDCSLEGGTRQDRSGLFAGMSRDGHRRHVIAQGPWRVMHPLSRLLTLFSEDDGDVIASLLRPGQRDWIRDQFLRVATLLHLPSHYGHDMGRSEPSGGSADTKAENLAKEIRKGAILMSGP
ncbi:hypothetical protein MY10362_004578 [Beauveria mimosiformis]